MVLSFLYVFYNQNIYDCPKRHSLSPSRIIATNNARSTNTTINSTYFSGKSWNVDSQEHILMLHGILHNCGAFDRLMSLLKIDHNVVAIDLPGHGRSSHFPPGAPLEFFQFVLAVKRVTNYLKWEKFSLVGHSFGGQIVTYFTAIFPQGIESVVVIDTMEPRPVLLHDTVTQLQTTLQRQLNLEDKLSDKSPPVYTHQQIFEKVKKNGDWGLSDEAAKDLIDRGVVQINGGYMFSFDQRLKYPSRPVLVFEQQQQIIKNIICPVLCILADGNMARYGMYLKQMYELNSKRSNTTIVMVKGDHAVHQNYPERISHLIDEFMITRKLNDKVEGVIHKGSEFLKNQ